MGIWITTWLWVNGGGSGFRHVELLRVVKGGVGGFELGREDWEGGERGGVTGGCAVGLRT